MYFYISSTEDLLHVVSCLNNLICILIFFSTEDLLHVVSCPHNESFDDVSCFKHNEDSNITIEIVRAHWGRSNDEICPNQLDNKNCPGIDVTEKIAEK